MVIGDNMGLAIFDNEWCCDNCGASFRDEDEFIYCPYCRNVLKNDWYQTSLQSIEKFLKSLNKSICEGCGEEFDARYNFCPLCSGKLKKERIMVRVEKDNSITACWNGEETCVFDKATFLSDPHFSSDTVIKCFKDKSYLDDKLESDFMEIGLKTPQKLTFKETYSIAELGTSTDEIRRIQFVMELDDDILSDEQFDAENSVNYINDKFAIVKVRKNLYAKLTVEHVRMF